MVKLSPNLVLSKTKTESLFAVKNLNLWGSSLDDVSILQEMPNVEILSLSVNKIASLRDFSYCPKLVELYLRKNDISSLSEVYHLQNLKNLQILWLVDNPCALDPSYRTFVIKTLPNLQKLDNSDITPEERSSANMAQFSVPRPALAAQTPAPAPASAPVSSVNRRDSFPVSSSSSSVTAVAAEPSQPRSRFSMAPSDPSPQLPQRVYDGDTYLYDEKSALKSVVPPSAYPQPSISAQLPSLPSPSVLGSANIPRNPASSSVSSSNPPLPKGANILVAVLALLNELDRDQLLSVRNDIDSKLSKFR